MVNEVNVYIDESGNTDIETAKGGASDFYALTAVVVPASDAGDLEQQLALLTQGAEIKSSKIRAKRRARWIQKIGELDFSYHVLIVDKKKIRKDSGLAYKKSFFKYFSRKMYDRLHRVHNIAHLAADDYGTNEFMEECERYYHNRVEKPMAHYFAIPGSKTMTFDRVDSRDSRLVQLADLICGTTRRVMEGKDDSGILKPIENMRLAFNVWPPAPRNAGVVEISNGFDALVQAVSYSETIRFMENSLDSFDEMEILASIVLSFLLDKYLENPESYYKSPVIREYLWEVEGFSVNDYKFKLVVAYIRSAGVPIASSGNGYKIPNNGSDIEDFVKKVQSTVDPYIQRLGYVRDLFRQVSLGEYDILKDQSLLSLKRYLDGG